MSVKDGFRLYYGNLGIKGAASIVSYRLFGRPRKVTTRCSEARHPVQLRMGTTDTSIFRSILRSKEYEFELPFSPRTIVDAGANIGMASIFFANRYPDAQVIAIEAEKANFEVLHWNTQKYPQIMALHAALWNRKGEIAVVAPDQSTGASGEWAFITREGQGQSVRAITIPSLMRDLGLSSIDILKVDIEGAEYEVFSDCSWITKVKCLMIEVHDRFKPGCSDVVSAATTNFSRIQRGETIVYLRNGDLPTQSDR